MHVAATRPSTGERRCLPDGVPVRYERHRPEQTALYYLVRQHAATFFAHTEASIGSALPRFVKDEFDAFLECGIPGHGLLRLRCGQCGHDRLLAFSCKRRGFCPSCAARRMSQTAAHLVDHVIPHVPVRQWVLSLPIPLRVLLAARPELVTLVLQVVQRGITRHLQADAGLRANEGQGGAVTLIQRFGSAANLNIHLHCLVLDGVYRCSADGAPNSAEADFDLGMKVNLDGARLLLDACRRVGHQPRLLFSSSIAVLGGDLPPVHRCHHADAAGLVRHAETDRRTAGAGLHPQGLHRWPQRPRADATVRPGKPNGAASGFASGIIREPLAGIDAILPVPDETAMWVASPRAIVAMFLHALALSPTELRLAPQPEPAGLRGHDDRSVGHAEGDRRRCRAGPRQASARRRGSTPGVDLGGPFRYRAGPGRWVSSPNRTSARSFGPMSWTTAAPSGLPVRF